MRCKICVFAGEIWVMRTSPEDIGWVVHLLHLLGAEKSGVAEFWMSLMRESQRYVDASPLFD